MSWVKGGSFPLWIFLLALVVGNVSATQMQEVHEQLLVAPVLLLSDDFDRGEGSSVGNGWEEIEATGAAAGIQANRLCFLDTSDVSLRPIVRHDFQRVASGQLRWRFDFDWRRQFRENSYQVLMQLGEMALMSDGSPDSGVGVNLVWTKVGGVHEMLAYRNQGADTPLRVISGAASLEMLVDLENQSYDLIIDGLPVQSGIPFDNQVNLDTVRFLTDGLNEVYFAGRCIDNLIIESIASEATLTPTPPATSTATNTVTLTATQTETPLPSMTSTPLPTDTPILTPTSTASLPPTMTSTSTPTATASATPTSTDTLSPSETPTPSATPSATDTPTVTATPTPTAESTILFSDAFERADGSEVGNAWVEVEAVGANAGIQGNQLCFLDTSDVLNRPLVRHGFSPVSVGVLSWEYDFNWARTGNEGTYRLFMQLGQGDMLSDTAQDTGVGVNLVWTNMGGVHQTLAYRLNGVTTGLGVVSGAARVRVEANLEAGNYAVYVNDGLLQAGIPFEDQVVLDTVRLFSDALNEVNFASRCFDNLVISHGSITGSAPLIQSTPTTSGTLWEAYSYDVNASGSPSPVYTLLNAPAGMAIDQATGQITWTPGFTGVFAVTVQAANLAGSDTQQYTLTISALPQFSCSAPVRIMPLGDSITAGKSSGVDDVTQQVSYRKDLWESLLAAARPVDFVGSLINGQFYPGFDPQHEGHSGWTDAQIAFHIYDNGGENWLSLNLPDVILLHIGTNALNPDPTDVQNILNEIDQYEAATNRRVIVVLARIIDMVPNNPTIHQFNDNVQAMAQARIENGDKVILVDMEDGADLIYSLQPAGDMWDRLHPFASGYTKMASVWLAALEDILPVCP